MQCPKCRAETPEDAQFCRRCHAPTRYTCPSCKHVQDHGGKCDQCGLDFSKYATALQFQARTQAELSRERLATRTGLIKQILLLPITGGLSLIKYVRSRLTGD